MRSLRNVLLIYELAFLALILVAGALAGLWAFFWQSTASASLRIDQQSYEALQLRSDLFLQIKEVLRGRLLEEPEAVTRYQVRVRAINERFNRLRRGSEARDEDRAIQAMQVTYRVIQNDLNNIFTNPYLVRPAARLQILDPRYEQQMVGRFETAAAAFQDLLNAQRSRLNDRLKRWTRLAPWLLPVPVVLALGLLALSRRSLQRQFVRPMGNLMVVARQIASGDLKASVPSLGATEMQELANAVNRMAEDLAQSRDTLVQQERQAALGALVPVVAHNIRNPLASIRATAQCLDSAEDPKEVAEVREAIIATVDRLTRWVGALVSYLHPLKPQLRPGRIIPMLEAVLALLGPRLAEKSIAIVWEGRDLDREVMVDADLMEQAFYALVANAIDASPRLGQLSLRIVAVTGQLEIHLEDEGPGLQFEPEPRGLVPGPSTKRRGTGLGIPVAHKIAEAHGWSLRYTRPELGGTRAVFTVRS